MTKPLSDDLRNRVVAEVNGGSSRRKAAERYAISHSAAIKVVHRVRTTGSVAPRPQGGDRRSARIEKYASEILALIAERADTTIDEMAAHLSERHAEKFSRSVIWRCLDRHAMTFKKNRTRQ